MLLLWVGFGAAGETVMGLKLNPLFTIPIAAGVATLVPLFAAHALPRGAWLGVTALALVAAVGGSICAGMQPAYSAMAPQRLSISYVQQSDRALWAVDALAPVPASMKAVAKFAEKPERLSPFAWSSSYVAPADNLKLRLPTAKLIANQKSDGGRRVTLALQGSDDANQMALILTNPKGLKAIDIKDWHFDAPPAWAKLDRVLLACMSRDCASAAITLTMADNAPVDAILGESRFGLPPEGARLVASRPNAAVPSQNGDGVLLISKLHVPGA
jgi:hypothetical protein